MIVKKYYRHLKSRSHRQTPSNESMESNRQMNQWIRMTKHRGGVAQTNIHAAPENLWHRTEQQPTFKPRFLVEIVCQKLAINIKMNSSATNGITHAKKRFEPKWTSCNICLGGRITDYNNSTVA